MTSIHTTLDRAQLGAAVTRHTLTMVPIQLEADHAVPDYVPLGEAIRSGRAKLTEISEGGSVPLLAVRNDADVALFILDGEELLGAKQNRIVNLSILVPARSILPIPVSCVERGRWSYRTRDFDVSPNTMFAAGRAEQMTAVTRCMTAFGRRDGDQRRVWDAVDERAAVFGAASPTSAMKDVYEARQRFLDDVLSGLHPQPSQAGAIFAVNGRVVGMELFETADMFATYFAKIARSYALDSLVTRMHGDFRAKDAETFLADVKSARPGRF